MEIVPVLNKELYDHYRKKYFQAWINERAAVYYDQDTSDLNTEGKTVALGISETENSLDFRCAPFAIVE